VQNFLPELLMIAGLHLLAVMSPGPDFLLVMRNSLLYSRAAGIWSSLGLACGIIVHVSYCLAGIGLIISQSVVLFSLLKYAGASYLIWIGWKSLRNAKPRESSPTILLSEDKSRISSFAAWRMGFLTNVLNPKVTLFLFALFTQVIRFDTPLAQKLVYGAEMVLVTFLWFSMLAYLLGIPRIRAGFSSVQVGAERVFGVLLIALGIKVATAHSAAQ
jgi:RhtB (resistance to homoserine/threonine) family protein